jgi:hypothetical protein
MFLTVLLSVDSSGTRLPLPLLSVFAVGVPMFMWSWGPFLLATWFQPSVPKEGSTIRRLFNPTLGRVGKMFAGTFLVLWFSATVAVVFLLLGHFTDAVLDSGQRVHVLGHPDLTVK